MAARAASAATVADGGSGGSSKDAGPGAVAAALLRSLPMGVSTSTAPRWRRAAATAQVSTPAIWMANREPAENWTHWRLVRGARQHLIRWQWRWHGRNGRRRSRRCRRWRGRQRRRQRRGRLRRGWYRQALRLGRERRLRDGRYFRRLGRQLQHQRALTAGSSSAVTPRTACPA